MAHKILSPDKRTDILMILQRKICAERLYISMIILCQRYVMYFKNKMQVLIFEY